MKGLIIGLIAVVLIGGGVWLVATQGTDDSEQANQTTDQTETETTQEEAPEEQDSEEVAQTSEVTYASSGFMPETITVPAGTTVTWTNESGRSMWVASDVHPTHEILSEFDQLGSGASYSFTFDEAGEWGYHNHLFPSHTGTVVVE